MNHFFQNDIKLENERVLLVPFSLEYKESLKKIVFDEAIWRYMGLSIRTEDELDEYINSTLQEKIEGKAYPFIMIDKESESVIGSTRFGNINFHNKRLEIGWTWYGTKFQGTGLNKACKYELLNYVFEQMQFNRVQFSADIDNYRSQKAILKLGAKQEGIFRSNYIDQFGNKRDDVYFSIITDEWLDTKKKFFSEFQFV
ncbi:GNAT family N-acetyltransferase [Viridibacillus sp. YIM B01967]|uniref:GNAT family N-acetyltransferase n=2 Tax=Viridibacillus soli TaxID=2798301 RepID=A0ABS1H4D0_9BACL|nr:GNAT family N-acetyltransferase [Viridibacillus soli]